MSVEEQVKAFVAEFSELPISEVHDNMDIECDIDWSRVHDDEHRDFYEYFIQHFEIYAPRFDFKRYSNEKGVSWYQIPFSYLKFKLFSESVVIENVTVSNLIEIAKNKHWDL